MISSLDMRALRFEVRFCFVGVLLRCFAAVIGEEATQLANTQASCSKQATQLSQRAALPALCHGRKISFGTRNSRTQNLYLNSNSTTDVAG